MNKKLVTLIEALKACREAAMAVLDELTEYERNRVMAARIWHGADEMELRGMDEDMP